MKTAFRPALLFVLAACLASFAIALRAAAAPPDFEELRQLVRTNLPGMNDEEFNRAAVEGLLESLRGKVRLLDSTEPTTTAPAIAKATVLDQQIAWLRVGAVTVALTNEINDHCKNFARTNKLTGLVLDLRFAGGDDYAAAAATADLFVPTEQSLLDWGKGVVKSSEKTNALHWPIVVLVNTETTGAAEALAAVLREAGVALILGGTTRGAAMTSQDFTLKNGQRLRIATAPVKLGNGDTIPTQGVKPDIEVAVSAAAERSYLEDPYGLNLRTNVATTATNVVAATNRVTRRARVSEADLVRARRDGVPLDGDLVANREREPEPPVIQDPALGRAVDLLKGLAVVRRIRP